MAFGQVHDVNVVAHAGAVFGGIVFSEDVNVCAPADGHLADVRHQVVGNALRVFADQPAGMRADGIEVAQQNDAPCGIGCVDVPQYVFDDEFSRGVGIGRYCRRVFFYRNDGRIAVNGS